MKQSNNRFRIILLLAIALIAFAAIYYWLSQNDMAEMDSLPDESKANYAGPFKVYVELDPAQAAIGDNTLTVILRDKDNQPVVDAQINAVAEMPAMGSMQAMSAPATMAHTGSGIYTGDFELPMNGAWPLSLEIESDSTGSAQLDFDLTTSRAGVRLNSATASSLSRSASVNSPASASDQAMAGKYRIQVQIEPDPPRVGKNRIKIIIKDESGQPVKGARVRAVAQMPAMGSMQEMNAPASISETEAGVYSGEIELAMKGEWPLAVDVETESLGHGDLIYNMTTGRKGLQLKTATPGDISHYTCSMHPSVKSATPGTCPICAMDLVPVTKEELKSGSISMDARRRQLIGVTTGLVEEKNISQIIRAAGRVTYNETQLTDITLKFNGWIGKLEADFVGASVTAGKPLFTVYSPELLSAQQEYLETLRHRKGNNNSLLKSARKRLERLDLTRQQVKKLEKRGAVVDYVPILSPVSGIVIEKNIIDGTAVKAGQKLMRIADLSTVWVEGEIYEYEIPLVKMGMDVEVIFPEMPGKSLPGKVSYIYPYMEASTRTAKLRVELDNSEGLLKPDMYAHVHINVDLGRRLVVPEGAVLYAGTSRVVFIDMGNGQLMPRKIKIGRRNDDVIEVLEGLKAGDRVVTSGNFLIAAESKLKAGLDQW